MACKSIFLLYSLVILVSVASNVQASDPELTTDFFVPEGVNASTIDGNYFTFTGFRGGANPGPNQTFAVQKAFSTVFPALTGLGVAYAFLDYLPGGLNPPHIHPRGSELLYVIEGSLQVGLLDSTNKLYNQTLLAGDLFIFPKGLVHYQFNPDQNVEAKALAAFSSSSPGVISLPVNIFGSKIPHRFLARAFNAQGPVISQLEAPYK